MLNTKAVKGVGPKSSHHKEKFSFSFILLSIWDDDCSLNLQW